MKDISPRSAGVFSAILALVLILLIYLMLGTVDIVFKQGDNQVYRINDVSVFSELTVPETDSVYVLTTDAGEVEFSDSAEFRFEIGKAVLVNFFSFKWDPQDNYIELYAK